ncbi:hypothetical protein [Saccharopolyspora erythraea]|nr:hypothetical protein [Saccharopolyspora erythraea]
MSELKSPPVTSGLKADPHHEITRDVVFNYLRKARLNRTSPQ